MAAARRAFGRLDGVVLNAGASTLAAAEQEDLSAFADVMAVNVTAQAGLAAAAARAMIPAGGGWMIAMSSILGRRAGTGAGVAAYAASKAAVEQLMRELARQWAPHGIRVNAIAPGYFPTAMNAPMIADPEAAGAHHRPHPDGAGGRRGGHRRGGGLPGERGGRLHHRTGDPPRRGDDRW